MTFIDKHHPIDFIGLGAQRSGTSWIYACLCEHPEIYIPIKEIHFFSRDRNWEKGYPWYESLFERRPIDQKAGEFSTSYLFDPESPSRIYQRYPHTKLIVSLRNPVDRAFSNYTNDIMSGRISAAVPFSEAFQTRPQYFEQGCYARQLERYFKYFSPEQLLVLIYEDSLRDPHGFIQRIFDFLGVDRQFVPSMLHSKVNAGYVPRAMWLEKLLRRSSAVASSGPFKWVWWNAKKLGFGSRLRALNSLQSGRKNSDLSPESRHRLVDLFKEETLALEVLVGKELGEWKC